MNVDHTTEWEMPPKTRSRAAEFRARARAALKGKWGIAILAMLLATLLGAFSTASGGKIDYESDGESARKIAESWISWANGFDSAQGLLQGLRTRFLDWMHASQLNVLTVGVSLFGVLTGFLYSLLLGGPVSVGYRRFGLRLLDGEQPRIGNLFDRFKQVFGKAVGTRFLLWLCQAFCTLVALAGSGLFLWSLLRYYYGETAVVQLVLGVAGGVLLMLGGTFYSMLLSLRFALCPFLIADYPEFTPAQVLGNSKSLMHGNKWRLVCLYFSFIGWLLLGAVTCGIAYLWVLPYVHTAEAAFYDEISERSRAGKIEFPSLDPNDYQQGVL